MERYKGWIRSLPGGKEKIFKNKLEGAKI